MPKRSPSTRRSRARTTCATSWRPTVCWSAIRWSTRTYLAAILTELRPVRWLALRVPALYKDEDWAVPKQQLKKYELAAYRRRVISPDENRALGACAAFRGDVLIVESEHDDIIPHPVVANYMAAFEKAHSLTYRVIEGADHGLSEEPWHQAFTTLLVNWVTEMVLGARQGEATPKSQAIGDRVFFESDSTDLTPTAIATLDKQAQWLSRYPRYTFLV